MLRMYCSHVAYFTTLRRSNSHHQSSPQEVLAVRGGAKHYFLDVPTFTTSRLPRDPSSQRWNCVGAKWLMNFAWNARLPRSIQGSFTCRKSTTWDRRLYFPSEGRLKTHSVINYWRRTHSKKRLPTGTRATPRTFFYRPSVYSRRKPNVILSVGVRLSGYAMFRYTLIA
jgi:hypothetical protein